MNQRGFATLEVIIMVVVIGILASVAVPRFTDVTTKANTAKIQADLSTIDTAIQMYEMDGNKVSELSNVEKLTTEKYLMGTPTPPTGSVFLKDKTGSSEIGATTYEIDTTNKRATLKIGETPLTADKFGSPKKSS